MKERPINFKTFEVQATLDQRKSQFRRIVKPQGKSVCFDVVMHKDGTDKWPRNLDADERFISYMKCPYGQPGDRLWVRETWNNEAEYYFIYKADAENGRMYLGTDDEGPQYANIDDFKWKPSIFMPREACRIFLEVVDVRVERLQEISEEDAIAEGINEDDFEANANSYNYVGSRATDHIPPAKFTYKQLWESINGKGSWQKNPWVWVVTFKRIEPCQTQESQRSWQ